VSEEQIVLLGRDAEVLSSNLDTYWVAPEMALEIGWLCTGIEHELGDIAA